MGFFDRIKDIVNVSKRNPDLQKEKRRNGTNFLARETVDTLKKWRDAIIDFEAEILPDNNKLANIYKEVILDAHVSSLINDIRLKLKGDEWSWVNDDGTVNEEVTELMNKPWFADVFIEACLMSMTHGFSLVELGDLINDAYPDIDIKKQERVTQQEDLYKTNVHFRGSGIKYTERKWINTIVPLGEKDDLGLLGKAAPLYIWKKSSIGNWSMFQDKFGVPTKWGKTNVNDQESVDELKSSFDESEGKNWVVTDIDTEIEFLQNGQTDAYEVFERKSFFCNSELSKLFVGQTMTKDDGSSRSQAEVHLEIFDSWIKGYKRKVEILIMKGLAPILVRCGVIPQGVNFKYDFSETISIQEQFEIDKEVMKEFNVDPTYITEKYGTVILGPKEEEATPPANFENAFNKMQNSIDNLYKDGLGHSSCEH